MLITNGVSYVYFGILIKVMPHRSFFTHTIILGDVIRIAYMLIVFSPCLFLLNVIALDGNLIEIAKKHEVEIVTFLMGIVGQVRFTL